MKSMVQERLVVFVVAFVDEGLPGQCVACKCGLLAITYRPQRGMVAYYMGLLDFRGILWSYALTI